MTLQMLVLNDDGNWGFLRKGYSFWTGVAVSISNPFLRCAKAGVKVLPFLMLTQKCVFMHNLLKDRLILMVFQSSWHWNCDTIPIIPWFYQDSRESGSDRVEWSLERRFTEEGKWHNRMLHYKPAGHSVPCSQKLRIEDYCICLKVFLKHVLITYCLFFWEIESRRNNNMRFALVDPSTLPCFIVDVLRPWGTCLSDSFGRFDSVSIQRCLEINLQLRQSMMCTLSYPYRLYRDFISMKYVSLKVKSQLTNAASDHCDSVA